MFVEKLRVKRCRDNVGCRSSVNQHSGPAGRVRGQTDIYQFIH